MKIYLKQDPNKNWLLYWGTSPNKIRYPINEKNVRLGIVLATAPHGEVEKDLAEYRRKKDLVYQGIVQAFEGSYSREMRTLTLEA